MREIIGLFGLSLSSFAAATYFRGIVTGICLGLFIIGAGLFIDALKR